ncbi:MAG: hypothetical protein AAGH41_10230 [Pseudomonadota bacterium]
MKYNSDIFIDSAEAETFAPIQDFLSAPALQERFAAEDRRSTTNKRLYRLFSFSVFLLVGVGVIASLCLVTVLSGDDAEPWLLSLAGGLSYATLVATAVQIVIWNQRFREKWLLARYAAERLRSVKAQLIATAGLLPPAQLNAETADRITKRHLVDLDQVVASGLTEVCDIDPSELFNLYTDDDVTHPHLGVSVEAYTQYRTKYQLRFARGEVALLEARERDVMSIVNTVVLFAGIFAACLSSLTFFESVTPLPFDQNVLIFISLSLFVASALLNAVERTSLSEPSVGRYRRYEDAIKRLLNAPRPDAADTFRRHVERMEGLAIDELREFIEDAKLLGARII